MTDTEKDTLCARIDELCAEVERLRVANAAFTGRSIRAGDKMACLEAENAKLRELANGYEALTATLCNERECDGCPFDDTEQIVCEHMRLQTCLSEMEVEVEDGTE